MKLRKIKKTAATLASFDDGRTVLFSYETPVAFFKSGVGFRKTEKYHSNTTSKHINQWLRSEGLDPKKVKTVSQADMESVAGGHLTTEVHA